MPACLARQWRTGEEKLWTTRCIVAVTAGMAPAAVVSKPCFWSLGRKSHEGLALTFLQKVCVGRLVYRCVKIDREDCCYHATDPLAELPRYCERGQ